jgi:hypothetical protein
MPTATAPKRRKCQPRPQDQRPAYVLVEGTPPPVVIPDPATLPKDLLYQRERAYAICMAYKFEEWLVLLAARDRVPLDDCLGTIGILTLYVEAFLVAAATWPKLYAVEEEGESEEPWEPAGGLAADRLSVHPVPPKRERLPRPTLPGCHALGSDGTPCQELRRYGERFCPCHMRDERRRLRKIG